MRTIRASASESSGISTPSRAGSHASMPRGASRSHWFTTECRGRRSSARSTTWVYIHEWPALRYPIRIGAPLAQVSQAARGPPWRSIAVANRRARRRRAYDRSSRHRASPDRLGTTITSSRWGLLQTTGAAIGSTTYVRCASGYFRRRARTNGVVNTTSPINLRRTRRIRLPATNYQLPVKARWSPRRSASPGYRP